MHEPRRGEYDFGEGQNDFSAFLNVTAFVEMAMEEEKWPLVVFLLFFYVSADNCEGRCHFNSTPSPNSLVLALPLKIELYCNFVR